MGSGSKVSQYLPEPKGPYIPGCLDVMLEYSASGIFTRLYYPTTANAEQSHHSKWIPWLVDENYLIRLANAFGAPGMIFRISRWWKSTDNLHIPTLYGEKVNTENKLKCVIFSHGYGGSRFMYTSICNELASQGYLVASMEHRDGSAPYTYYYKSKEDAENDVRSTVPLKTIYFGRAPYSRVNPQVHHRSDECSKALDFLINLNNGVIPYNIIDDLKIHNEINFKFDDFIGKLDLDNITIIGHSFGAATALCSLSKRKELKQGIILDPWMFCVKEESLTENITQPLLFINTPAFHDSTSLELMKEYLTNEQRQMYTVLQGILLDPWMFPIKSEENITENITQPLLFINTQTFHILPNVRMMEKYLTNEHRKMYTILHTTHENQTDSVCVMGYWLNWFMKKLNPYAALKINNALILSFLNEYTGHAEDIKDCESFLREQEANVASGLTKPWA